MLINKVKQMKLLVPLFTLLTACFGTSAIKSKPTSVGIMLSTKTLYDFKMKSIDGQLIDFSKYKGKKVLIVNTASECGYTPQYAELELLHKKYGEKLVVLGFPANNFAGQEPGDNKEIASFCQKNYGVTFQLFEKVSVRGDDACDLYKWLSTKELNGWNSQAPKWNFNKYLIDENGQLIKYFPSSVKPMSKEITDAI
jgi:glutathione peroxidase